MEGQGTNLAIKRTGSLSSPGIMYPQGRHPVSTSLCLFLLSVLLFSVFLSMAVSHVQSSSVLFLLSLSSCLSAPLILFPLFISSWPLLMSLCSSLPMSLSLCVRTLIDIMYYPSLTLKQTANPQTAFEVVRTGHNVLILLGKYFFLVSICIKYNNTHTQPPSLSAAPRCL